MKLIILTIVLSIAMVAAPASFARCEYAAYSTGGDHPSASDATAIMKSQDKAGWEVIGVTHESSGTRGEYRKYTVFLKKCEQK